jgi:hypothetical protein
MLHKKQRHLQYPIPDGIFPRPPAYVISSIAKTALFSLYTSIDQLMSLFLAKLRQRRRKWGLNNLRTQVWYDRDIVVSMPLLDRSIPCP